MTITVGIGALTITDVVNVARHDTPIILDPAALAEVAKTRQHIEELATEPTPVYGVSTGFGALRSSAPNCSAAWCAPTPPDPARRWNATSSAPSCCFGSPPS